MGIAMRQRLLLWLALSALTVAVNAVTGVENEATLDNNVGGSSVALLEEVRGSEDADMADLTRANGSPKSALQAKRGEKKGSAGEESANLGESASPAKAKAVRSRNPF